MKRTSTRSDDPRQAIQKRVINVEQETSKKVQDWTSTWFWLTAELL